MRTSIHDERDESSPDPAEVASRRVGQVFASKWRIERVLGAGGMATVYAATHTNNQRAVALKVLHTELTASGDIKKRFLREGFIANRIGHPGAVAILDDGVDDEGHVFLVMELLNGASVADRIRAGRDAPSRRAFGQAEVLRIADGTLDVLVAAHAQGILHRDLKPDNVFVTESGEVKVLDFGIARLREPQSGSEESEKGEKGEKGEKSSGPPDPGEAKTQTGVLLGTPQYMPPEQARGRSSLVDERSDLWSLGAMVFTMLTGRHVHEAETPNEALLKAMTATAAPLASVLPNVDPRVASIVDRALAFDQAARYPNARAMQADVREAIAQGVSESAELAPTSGGAALSVPRPVTSVTKSAVPIVRDTNRERSGGWRVLAVVGAIGVFAVGGRALVVRLSPHLGAGDATIGPLDAGLASASEPVTGGPFLDAAIAPGAANADAPAPRVGDASADAADLVDAEADDEDDDGGEDEEEVTIEYPTPAAGHAAVRGALPAHHPVAAPHKVDPHKKRKKKKKKR